jgi:mono/diheme cytochrome c family protein
MFSLKIFFKPHYLPVLLLLALPLLAACENMQDQPRYDPLEASTFFPDGRSARPLVPGTVPRGAIDEEPAFYTGVADDDSLLDENPLPITLELLERGRERYDIYCAPCHGIDGYGSGMIVQRGFPAPQSFHIDRLRQAPDGYYFHAITNGFGRMYAYDYRIKTQDRWAVIAYIRALQLSQFAEEQDVPPEVLPELEGNTP